MKCSQRPWFVIITQRSPKRHFYLPPPSSKIRKPWKHIERAAASGTMTILYDYPTLEDEHDKTLMDIHGFIDRMSAASAPGAHLVELITWIIHIPERYMFMLF